MGRFEQYLICYEDRDDLHTSRWLLDGVSTAAAGNTHRGWLFLTAGRTGQTVTLELYKDPDCGAGDKVATGSADVSAMGAAVKVDLTEANDSGLSGQVYLESYAADPPSSVPVLVSLCTDADLAELWRDIDSLPSDVYDAACGMAAHCAVATRRVLLLAGQMYAEELGGYGGPEHVHYAGATRMDPDWRRLIVPDQLSEAAACWALELALGSCHSMAEETMYSQLRDHFAQRRREAVGGWNLTFNTNPDADADADASKSPSAVRLSRI